MLKSLTTATHNFIYHQLRLEATPPENLPAHPLHCCSILLFDEDGSAHKTLFYYDLPFLRLVCEAMLFENAPDESTLVDMAKECTNLIAGSAKLISQEDEGKRFEIALPIYEGVAPLQTDGTAHAIAIDEAFALAISL